LILHFSTFCKRLEEKRFKHKKVYFRRRNFKVCFLSHVPHWPQVFEGSKVRRTVKVAIHFVFWNIYFVYLKAFTKFPNYSCLLQVIIQSKSRIKINKASCLFLSRFLPLLNWASFFKSSRGINGVNWLQPKIKAP